MKNSSPKFRTTNLDLACVLVSQGYGCTTKKLGPVSAVFEFDKNTEIEYAARQFYRGELEGNITSFMYARFALKRELSMKSVEWKLAAEGRLMLSPGQFYYYVADDGKAYKNTFSNREPHVTRVLNGNAFLTMQKAQEAAANTKID